VSPSWREEPTSVKVLYEELTAAPEATLGRIAREIGEARLLRARANVAELIDTLRLHSTYFDATAGWGQVDLTRCRRLPERAIHA